MRDAKSKDKSKEFDDFLSGKEETRTLQDLFKEYYDKASEMDLKEAAGGKVNSALNSLNGFS